MKTDIKHLAAYAATAIWADGEYDAAEKIVLEEIAEAYEVDYALLTQEVEAALEEIKDKSEEEIDAYLRAHSVEVEEDEAELIYLAALQIVLVDGVLGAEEVNNLLSIASTLGMDDEMAVLLLADMVKEEPELVVEF
ncbi:MAG: TerB family tellurite resistance protein [Alistipes sp.]|nr:TerB family tellurite resistance protein [Alistipes sp.]